LIFALRLLGRFVLLDLFGRLYIFNLIVVFFVLLGNGSVLLVLVLLSKVVVKRIRIVLVQFADDVVELVDVGAGVEEKGEQRVRNSVGLIFDFFFQSSHG
jgi:hypothetical protein